MTAAELREKVRLLVPTLVGNKKQAEAAAVEYDELTKFPELKRIIVDLLTYEFDNFIASIDWVAPKPTTFRINLKNGFNFYGESQGALLARAFVTTVNVPPVYNLVALNGPQAGVGECPTIDGPVLKKLCGACVP